MATTDLVLRDLGGRIEGRVGQDIGSRLSKLYEGAKDPTRRDDVEKKRYQARESTGIEMNSVAISLFSM